MKILDTRFKDCFLIKPDVHRDSRGFFLESFQLKRYQTFLGLKDPLVQDNFSRSSLLVKDSNLSSTKYLYKKLGF